MASGLITSWQIEGGQMEAVTDFLFLGSKITANGNSSHENKWCLLLGRKAMTNLESILKNKEITVLAKDHIVKAMFFLDVRVGPWVGWELKNWCFQIVVLEKTLESPLQFDCKKMKLVNPKGNPLWISFRRTDGEAEAPVLGYLMWRVDSLEKTLLPGKTEGRRRRQWQRIDGWMASLTQWNWVWTNSGK